MDPTWLILEEAFVIIVVVWLLILAFAPIHIARDFCDVDVPGGDDTEFTVTAEIVSPGLSLTGPTGAASTRQTAAVLVLILIVLTGLGWRRWV